VDNQQKITSRTFYKFHPTNRSTGNPLTESIIVAEF